MTLLDIPTFPFPVEQTFADRQAQRNRQANWSALRRTQPSLLAGLGQASPDVTWLFARDGTLSCQEPSGRWWGGCSVPGNAGLAMLRKLELPGVTGCLIAPTHAGEIAAALTVLCPTQAIIVIEPQIESLWVALHSVDFSVDLERHRLWFAVGRGWDSELSQLLEEQPGLPVPSRFIRTPALPEATCSQVIPIAEAAIIAAGSQREAKVQEIVSSPRLPVTLLQRAPRLCVVSGSAFRLWEDTGAALLDAICPPGDPDIHHLDADDPASNSSLALALQAANADAVVTHNRGRLQLPSVVRADCPIISWMTTPSIPAPQPGSPGDALLLADPAWLAQAISIGWPEDRLAIAQWPANPINIDQSAMGTPGGISLIADTQALETPKEKMTLSSHHVLWEMVREELLADPFVLGPDVMDFLDRHRSKIGIGDEGFDAAWFVERLVVPAYQQGLARVLLNARLPLKLYGRGWDAMSDFSIAAAGPVNTRDAFRSAIAGSGVLVYPWPVRFAHPIDSLDRPVLNPGRHRIKFVENAITLLKRPVCEKRVGPMLCRASLRRWLQSSAAD